MKNIAVVTGGNSSEYVISVKSADTIIDNLNKEKYRPFRIEIKNDNWTAFFNESSIEVNKSDFSIVFDGQKINFDAALIMIHGAPGEDGKIQSYFELMGIPYTSSGVLSSALTFDKHYTKMMVKALDLPTSPWLHYFNKKEIDYKAIENNIGYPCFVKPTNAGSSFGVTKANNEDELHTAIENSFKEDNQGLLIEKLLSGTEVTCGVFYNGNNITKLPIAEIVSKNDFFDYEAKYTVGMADEIIPARIPEVLGEQIQDITASLYKAFNCRWFCRIDYIIEDNKPYFIEANTIPGMSAESIIPKMLREANIPLTEALDVMIEQCIKK